MSMMVSFVLSFFPRDVLDEILNLIESVSEDFPSYSLVNLKFLYRCFFVLTSLTISRVIQTFFAAFILLAFVGTLS